MLVSHLSLFSVFASLLLSAQVKDAHTNVAEQPKRTILGAVTEPTDEQYALLKVEDSEALKRAALKVGFELVEKDNIRFLIPDRYGSKNPYSQAIALISALQQVPIGDTLSMKDLPPDAQALLRQAISTDPMFESIRGTMLERSNLSFDSRVSANLTLKNGTKTITLSMASKLKPKPQKSPKEDPNSEAIPVDPEAEARFKKNKSTPSLKPFSLAFYFDQSPLDDVQKLEIERQYVAISLKKVKALKAQYDVALSNASRNILSSYPFGEPLSDKPVDFSQLPAELQDRFLSDIERNASKYGFNSPQDCRDFLKNATIAVDGDSCQFGLQFQQVKFKDSVGSVGSSLRLILQGL